MHIHVRLTDCQDCPGIEATALAADGRVMERALGTSRTDALDELELRLLLAFGKPVTFHIDDQCKVLPHVRVVVEDIAYCGIFVATSFDDHNVELARGECCCCAGAIEKCLVATAKAAGSRSLNVTLEVLNPDVGDESDADC